MEMRRRMLRYVQTCLLLALLTASSSKLVFGISDSNAEECGDIQHNVENGMIRLPEFSGDNIKDINCSWIYIASAGRKLLVKVDNVHLPPSDLRTSSFQLYIDNQLHDIPKNCVKCLREMVGGKAIKVLFSSFMSQSAESRQFNASESEITSTEGIGSFQVRYKSFDPLRCSKPEQIENGQIISKGRKLGQSIFYRCNPPYDLIGKSEMQCVIPIDSPVPEWSGDRPSCGIQDCTNGPFVREALSGSIASPGYPTYRHDFFGPCIWTITIPPNQQINVSITYLKLPQHPDHDFTDNPARLNLIDGDFIYIANLTESLSSDPLNFTTTTNKLTLKFIVNEQDNKRKETMGFYLDYSAISSSCPKPKAPVNGEVIAYSNEFGSVAAYRCDKGYLLVGEFRAECLQNGQWSHLAPTCESVTPELPTFVSATNDSDIVTAKLSEIATFGVQSTLTSAPSKSIKSNKKKMKDYASASVSTTEFLEAKATDLPIFLDPDRRTKIKNPKKHDKENGPKSEPHLSQIIPPKNSPEKSPSDYFGRPPKTSNSSKPYGQLPDLEDGLNRNDTTKRHPLMTMTMISIIAGVGAPVAVAIILTVVVIIYRRRYPVRMRFGRKFSTFENPVYVSKDAHHPRELKRLTT